MAHYAIPSEREFTEDKIPQVELNGLASTMNKDPKGPKKGLLGKLLKAGAVVGVATLIAYPILNSNNSVADPRVAFYQEISQTGYKEVPVMQIPETEIECKGNEYDHPECHYGI